MKLLLPLLLPVLILFSCSKSDSDVPAQDGKFNITGVRDVDLSTTSSGSYSFNVTVSPTGSDKESVELSAVQLPGGVYVTFSPREGTLPFTSRVTVYTDYTGSLGGTFPFLLKGTGKSGSRSYEMKVTTAPFVGWKVGGGLYEAQEVSLIPGNTKDYSQIRVSNGQGAQLILSFAKGVAIPTRNSTFKIAADSSTADNIAITFDDGANLYRATGYNTYGTKGVTGTFTFDTLKKFIFRCDNVEISDGFTKQPLSCNFSQK